MTIPLKINNYINKISTYTGYFTSDNESGGIKNATHNTSAKVNVDVLNVVVF
jgi:hypothetical protein